MKILLIDDDSGLVTVGQRTRARPCVKGGTGLGLFLTLNFVRRAFEIVLPALAAEAAG